MSTPTHPLDRDELARRIAALPALPPLVMDLLASLQQENLDVATLARRIAADQGLLVRTLRIANSPFYGLAGQVDSLDEAILVLGFRTVRSLVLGAGIVGGFRHKAGGGFRAGVFWRHSVAVAVCARALARARRANAEAAFTGGLLHDLGRYVMALCYPLEFERVLHLQAQRDCPHLEAERAVLGVDHAEVGVMLARAWGLPEGLIEGISCHHEPGENGAADLMHCAEVLAHALELGHEHRGMVPPMDHLAWQRSGFDAATLAPLLGQIENEYEEVCNALLS